MRRIFWAVWLATAFGLATPAAQSQERGPTPARARPVDETQDNLTQSNALHVLTAAYLRTKDATAADDFSQVIEVCERALALRPAQKAENYARQLAAWAYNRRGELYMQHAALGPAGRWRKASEMDALALDDFSSSVRLDPSKWRFLHNRGLSLALHGKLQAAVEELNRAVQLAPEQSDLFSTRADILALQGKWQQAADDYSHVLRHEATLAAQLGRANAYMNLDRPAEAWADFNAALRHDPGSAAAYAGRGDAHVALGRWEQAGEDYRQAMKLDKELGRALRGAAWFLAVCPIDRFRNPELALQAAQRAIALDGDGDWTYLDALAAAQARAGQYASALGTIEKTIQIAPDKELPALAIRKASYASGQPYVHGESATARVPGMTNR